MVNDYITKLCIHVYYSSDGSNNSSRVHDVLVQKGRMAQTLTKNNRLQKI
jgi:hypothetical protein